MKKLVYIICGLVFAAALFFAWMYWQLMSNPCSEVIGPNGETEYVCI